MTILTERQYEVAQLIGDGHSYKVVAARLVPPISVDGVAQHVTAIAEKIGAQDDGLDPRDVVFLWIRQQRWAAAHEQDERRASA